MNWLQSQGRRKFGGARRNRTDDLFNAIEALSQLSYGPIYCFRRWRPSIGSEGRSDCGADVYAQKRAAHKARGDEFAPSGRQGSSSGAISPSISALTSSSSSSSSSRKASSAASSSSTSISSTTGSATFSSVASTSSSETSSTPAGATASSSTSSSFALARSTRATTPWKIVPHFGQTIGSLFRSKNLAPQF